MSTNSKKTKNPINSSKPHAAASKAPARGSFLPKIERKTPKVTHFARRAAQARLNTLPNPSPTAKREANLTKREAGPTKKHKKRAPKPPMTQAEYAKLQAHWYAKLVKDGFRDIEVDKRGMTNVQGRLQTNSNANLSKKFNTETRHYYRQWSCWLVNNKEPCNEYGQRLTSRQIEICRLHSEGVPYRQIVKLTSHMRAKRKLTTFTISQFINSMRNIVVAWNKRSVKGLDFVADVGLAY